MKKLFLRAEFGPLWEPWEEDEIGRKTFLYRLTVFAIAKSLGLITAIIQDAGRTQIEAGNKTFKGAIYFQKNILSFQKF